MTLQEAILASRESKHTPIVFRGRYFVAWSDSFGGDTYLREIGKEDTPLLLAIDYLLSNEWKLKTELRKFTIYEQDGVTKAVPHEGEVLIKYKGTPPKFICHAQEIEGPL